MRGTKAPTSTRRRVYYTLGLMRTTRATPLHLIPPTFLSKCKSDGGFSPRRLHAVFARPAFVPRHNGWCEKSSSECLNIKGLSEEPGNVTARMNIRKITQYMRRREPAEPLAAAAAATPRSCVSAAILLPLIKSRYQIKAAAPLRKPLKREKGDKVEASWRSKRRPR